MPAATRLIIPIPISSSSSSSSSPLTLFILHQWFQSRYHHLQQINHHHHRNHRCRNFYSSADILHHPAVVATANVTSAHKDLLSNKRNSKTFHSPISERYTAPHTLTQNLSISADSISNYPIRYFKGAAIVASSPEIVEANVHKLLDKNPARIIGFDTEFRPTLTKNKISTIQLASNNFALIIQCLNWNNFTLKNLPNLSALFADPSIFKAGQAPYSEMLVLQQHIGFKEFNSFVDIEYISRIFHSTPTNLRASCAIYLGFTVSKAQQTSDWNAETLTKAQIRYAATDAWVCQRILYAQLSIYKHKFRLAKESIANVIHHSQAIIGDYKPKESQLLQCGMNGKCGFPLHYIPKVNEEDNSSDSKTPPTPGPPSFHSYLSLFETRYGTEPSKLHFFRYIIRRPEGFLLELHLPEFNLVVQHTQPYTTIVHCKNYLALKALHIIHDMIQNNPNQYKPFEFHMNNIDGKTNKLSLIQQLYVLVDSSIIPASLKPIFKTTGEQNNSNQFNTTTEREVTLFPGSSTYKIAFQSGPVWSKRQGDLICSQKAIEYLEQNKIDREKIKLIVKEYQEMILLSSTQQQ